MTFFVARKPILWPDPPTKWQTLHHCLLSKIFLVGDHYCLVFKKPFVLVSSKLFELRARESTRSIIRKFLLPSPFFNLLFG